MSPTIRWIPFAVLAALAAFACAQGPSVYEARKDRQAGDVESAAAKLETVREQRPTDMEAWNELTDLYYEQWRLAEDEGRNAEAVRYLGLLQGEILDMVETVPEDATPHTWMGIVAAYQNDLDSALENFTNARSLEPRGGIHYSNLAHVWVYKGKLSRATPLLKKARRFGTSPSELDRIEVLAAWRRGDFMEARDVFAMALDVPGFAETWDGVPLPAPMETFEDFAEACCANRACGPNMGRSCERLDITVNKRTLEAEAMREEMRLEIERRRRLREIYEERTDLEIVVEEQEEAPADDE